MSSSDAGHATRIRRVRSLLLEMDAQGIVATEYIARRSLVLDVLSLRLLQVVSDWMRPEDVFERLGLHDQAGLDEEGQSREGGPSHDPASSRERVAAELIRLIDLGFVVVERTAEAEQDEQFAREWEWGTAAASFHFGLRGTQYQDAPGIAQHLAARAATQPRVPLVARSDAPDVVKLEVPPRDHPLMAVLKRRRSRRAFGEQPVPLKAVAECLFASMAIVGRTRVVDEWLPVKMTPSGGARNPFDALVYAWNVDGLARGLHRYLPETHGLEPIATRDLPPISALVGDQAWFSGAGAVLLLVATFRRTMWKYPHPGALRVVMIEAGHIAQNMLVCAAHHGLLATPTCAVSDLVLERVCGLDPIRQAVLHAVVLGSPGGPPSEGDFAEMLPNEAIPGWLDGL